MRAVLVSMLFMVIACVAANPGPGPAPSSRPSPGPTNHDPIEPHPGGGDDPAGPGGGAADGSSCSTADDCKSHICEGEGCGPGAGKCAPATRGCTRDLREYCGCDGKTFRASGSCPGQRFSARAACAGN